MFTSPRFDAHLCSTGIVADQDVAHVFAVSYVPSFNMMFMSDTLG